MSSNICRYLNAIIAEGSFSRAAHRLGISQPSLSQFVVRLETEAGSELVDRSARPLRLTAAGELFLRTEAQVDLLRETAARQMLDIREGVRGRVTIGATDYRETFFLSEVLPVFRERHPLIEISVAEGRTKELEEMALAGATDLSLVISPLFHSRGLKTEVIHSERILLVTGARHPIARAHPETAPGDRPTVDFRELDREPFIRIKRGQQISELFEDLCDRTGAAPRVVLESESMIAAAALAGAGLGAALTTETIVRRMHRSDPLRAFELTPVVPPRTVVAAYRSDRYLSKAARALIAVMKEVGRDAFANG